jgi:hypothetical protein
MIVEINGETLGFFIMPKKVFFIGCTYWNGLVEVSKLILQIKFSLFKGELMDRFDFSYSEKQYNYMQS